MDPVVQTNKALVTIGELREPELVSVCQSRLDSRVYCKPLQVCSLRAWILAAWPSPDYSAVASDGTQAPAQHRRVQPQRLLCQGLQNLLGNCWATVPGITDTPGHETSVFGLSLD